MKFVGYQSQCKRYQELCLISLSSLESRERKKYFLHFLNYKTRHQKIVSNYNENKTDCSYISCRFDLFHYANCGLGLWVGSYRISNIDQK